MPRHTQSEVAAWAGSVEGQPPAIRVPLMVQFGVGDYGENPGADTKPQIRMRVV